MKRLKTPERGARPARREPRGHARLRELIAESAVDGRLTEAEAARLRRLLDDALARSREARVHTR